MRALGADGCRGGWIGVVIDDRGAHALFRESLESLRAAVSDAQAVVDCPIGLPETWRERRLVDREARALLKRANADRHRGVASRVFPAPPRRALDLWREGWDYHAINATSDGKKLTRQTFHILRTIGEADALVREQGQERLVEGHPEIGFARHAGRTFAPKRSDRGRRDRSAALSALGFDVIALRGELGRSRGRWAVDDLLDACILAHVARRRAQGDAERVPTAPRSDACGLRMEIWF